VRRVTLVSEAKVFGGAEVYLEGLARSFSRWRAEVAVPDRRELAGWRAALAAAGVSVLAYAPTPAGWMDLARRLRRSAPDLVHLNLPSTYDGASGLAALWFRLAAGRPVVVTEHLTQLPRSRRRRLTKRAAAGAVRATLVASRASRSALVGEGMDAERIFVVPNGVPDPGPARPLPAGEPLCIGFLATLEPRKHADLLVQVLAGLREVPLRLTLGGDGPLRPALERLVERLGQEDRVSFAGWVDDVPGFLAAQHLLALPSRLEGMPLIVLDAFAAGRGVLVTDLPGLEEVVEDGRTGRRLPVSDVETWTAAVRAVAADRDLLVRWGRSARDTYLERFTAQRAARETEAIYDRVLAEGTGR
jgi:glycosyltransferase involved in cell wall biosynthesis